MAITNELHKVVIFVPDPTVTLVDFDKITLYKSTTGSSGDFTEILKSAAAPATLTSKNKEGYTGINGKEFKFSVDGTEYSVTFAAAYTAAEVANEIVLATGQIATDAGGYVQINSATTGLDSTIEIETSTEGGVILGYYLNDFDIGEAAWLDIVAGTYIYVVDDPNSDNDYWYKTRYVNSATLVTSDYSSPFRPRPLGAIPPDDLIFGTGKIADLEGNPVANKKIVVYNKYVPTQVGGVLVDGPQTTIYETDEQGDIAIPLVKGSRIAIGIEDTKLRRDIDVPTGATAQAFDLLDETLLDDRLGITYYPIVDGERTIL